MKVAESRGLGISEVVLFGTYSVFFMNFPSNNVKDKMFRTGSKQEVADPGFPRGGGANSQSGGANLLFGQHFPENCMKMKEFGPTGGARVPGAPLDTPMTNDVSRMADKESYGYFRKIFANN